MTPHRLALFASVPLVGLALLSACSSSSNSDPGTGTGPSGCPSDPFATNGLDLVKTDRTSACARYVAALKTKAESLHCALNPIPECPAVLDDFESNLKKANPDVCIDGYSAGTIANCECRVAAYASCSDFARRPCELGVLQPADGHKCPADGGVDTGGDSELPDTSAADSAPEGGGDAGGGG